MIDDSGNVFGFGTMDNIKYFVQSDTNWLITGHWISNGQSGSFQFTGAGNANAFTGGWLFDPPTHGGGSWRGSRII